MNLLLDTHILIWLTEGSSRLSPNPLDRLLIAQAQAESLTLISSDTDFQGYEVEGHLSYI